MSTDTQQYHFMFYFVNLLAVSPFMVSGVSNSEYYIRIISFIDYDVFENFHEKYYCLEFLFKIIVNG